MNFVRCHRSAFNSIYLKGHSRSGCIKHDIQTDCLTHDHLNIVFQLDANAIIIWQLNIS